jgi:hypothetical protein
MTAPILVLVSSVADSRAMLAVARELEARGHSARFVAMGGPGLEHIEPLLHAARRAFRVIGATAPLNATRLLREEKPSAILLGADNLFFHHQLVLAARRRRIPTILVQEAANEFVPVVTVRKGLGSLASHPRRAWMRTRLMLAHGHVVSLARMALDTTLDRPRRAIGYGFGGVNIFCVADESVRDAYEHRGSNAGRIAVTGLPALVPHIDLREPDHDVVLLTQPLDTGGFAPPGWKQEFFGMITRAVRQVRPTARILCKPHPTESAKEYADLDVDGFSSDLADAIARSRVAVSVHSAALAAALANGRPGIACVPAWLHESSDNMIIESCRRLGLLAHDEDSLAPIVQRLLSAETPWTPDHVPFALCADGLAAARIADEVALALQDSSKFAPLHA